MPKISTPYHITFEFIGPEIDYGRLPAFFYFALSAEQSLHTPPYNAPTLPFGNQACRVFSVTLPDHGISPAEHTAIQKWGDNIAQGHYELEDFLKNVALGIQFLIDEGYVLEEKMALGGLSRGGFIALHLASKLPQVRYLLAFAPLTSLEGVEDFKMHMNDSTFQRRIDHLNPIHLIEKLTHLQYARFYIGNRDVRVHTDSCYQFVRLLTEKLHEKHARHAHVELFITQSIGFKGHGTSPEVFEEGALFLKHHLLEV